MGCGGAGQGLRRNIRGRRPRHAVVAGYGRRLRVDGDCTFVCLMLVGRLLAAVLKIIGGGFACAILAWCSQTGV